MGTGWFKSTYSTAGSNGCVEVRFADRAVGVRDSKNPTGPRLSFTPDGWRAFRTRLGARLSSG